MSTELPTNPKTVKRMEKVIAKEAQADEKNYKRALKELKRTEMLEAKASKAASKADEHLKKMESKEHDTVKSLQKATHKHDRAVTNLHTAQSDVQIQIQQAQKLRRNVGDLRLRTDELLRDKHARDEERSLRLAHLRSPDRTTAATEQESVGNEA